MGLLLGPCLQARMPLTAKNGVYVEVRPKCCSISEDRFGDDHCEKGSVRGSASQVAQCLYVIVPSRALVRSQSRPQALRASFDAPLLRYQILTRAVV